MRPAFRYPERSIIAIVVYALIAWGLVNLLQTFAYQATTRTHTSYDRYQI